MFIHPIYPVVNNKNNKQRNEKYKFKFCVNMQQAARLRGEWAVGGPKGA